MSNAPFSSHHSVPVRTLKEEARFYNEAQHTYDNLEDFKKKVMRQNLEFNTLLQYYQQNEGRIDFSSVMDGNGGLKPHRPNVGTDSQSWFYLDERGNKIWVQNMKLDTSDVKTGAFAANQHADGKVIVVKVPTHKRNYCLQPDYKKKCMEYDSYRRLQQVQNPPTRPSSAFGSRPSTAAQTSPHKGPKYPMVAPYANPQNGGVAWVPGTAPAAASSPAAVPPPSDVNRYVEAQQRLAADVVASQQQQFYHNTMGRGGGYPSAQHYHQQQDPSPLYTSQGNQYVYRPPTSIEEADARLEELRREEAWLRQQVQQ